jgi:hypothetical protein
MLGSFMPEHQDSTKPKLDYASRPVDTIRAAFFDIAVGLGIMLISIVFGLLCLTCIGGMAAALGSSAMPVDRIMEGLAWAIAAFFLGMASVAQFKASLRKFKAKRRDDLLPEAARDESGE